MIPTSVITGFLGSGKTTFISRILRDPRFARTAVIVNEFGEVGLDHHLISSSDESVVTLTTGCVCCAVQSDLGRTLLELLERRKAAKVAYDRILIETSGLADPLPMLQAMMTDRNVSATHQIADVVTLVDVVHGEQTLAERIEARHQVAVADKLLLTKTDIRAVEPRLVHQLAALNPTASRMTTREAGADELFRIADHVARSALVAPLPRRRAHDDVQAITVTRETPIPALVLPLLLQSVAEHCGSRMLRLKGLLAIREMPGRPALVHGVRHVVSPPEFLDSWPSDDQRTRMVFIVKSVPQHFFSRLLDAIEDEVQDETGFPG